MLQFNYRAPQVRVFAIRDLKTGEEIYRGEGNTAQEVYEAWRREDLRPLEYPKSDLLESVDDAVRAAGFADLRRQDSWIDDDEITMHNME